MGNHNCRALVVTCMDFRIQPYVQKWLKEHFKDKEYDLVAFAGGIYDLNTILKQVDLSYNLHHIHQVVLINHEDCGAYGTEGTYERHIADLKKAGEKIKKISPTLKTDTYYLYLDGTFEAVNTLSFINSTNKSAIAP